MTGGFMKLDMNMILYVPNWYWKVSSEQEIRKISPNLSARLLEEASLMEKQ
jgi:hypothetical protein